MQIPFEIVNKRWGIIFLFIVENGHWFFLLLVLKAHCISEQKVLHNSTQQISINFWSLFGLWIFEFLPCWLHTVLEFTKVNSIPNSFLKVQMSKSNCVWNVKCFYTNLKLKWNFVKFLEQCAKVTCHQTT